MKSDLFSLRVRPESPIREAMAYIDRNEKGIVLATDEEGHLLGTITDGDVRRAILAGESLDSLMFAGFMDSKSLDSRK